MHPSGRCLVAHAHQGVVILAAELPQGPVFAITELSSDDPRDPVGRLVPIPPGDLRGAACGYDLEGRLTGFALVGTTVHAVPLGIDTLGEQV